MMRKRSRDNIDGVLGALTYKAIQERQTEKITPIYIGGKHYGDVTQTEQEPPRSPYNCPNCCAPITKPYCEYCGTVFERTIYKLEKVPKKKELERIKSRLYADDLLVYEAFEEFHEVAHELPPKLPIKKQR